MDLRAVRARPGARLRGRLLRGRARAVRGRARRLRGRLQGIQRGLHRRLLLVLLAFGPAARRGPRCARARRPPPAESSLLPVQNSLLPVVQPGGLRGNSAVRPSSRSGKKSIPCLVRCQAGAGADGCSLSLSAGRHASRL